MARSKQMLDRQKEYIYIEASDYEEEGLAMLSVNGEYFYIDLEDYDEVYKHSWNTSCKDGYVRRTGRKGKQSYYVSLCRFLVNAPNDKLVDHRDGDILNNRKSNLRVCTKAQNNFNRKIQDSNTSGYKGVIKKDNKWQAQIKANRVHYYLGLYKTPEEAALAYNEAAIKLHGEFANINKLQNK